MMSFVVVLCFGHAVLLLSCVHGAAKDNSIACNCNNHSIYCTMKKERICLDCQHNTTGNHCEFCSPGYYGNATLGTKDACKKCPCELKRSSGSCYIDTNGTVTCNRCLAGYTGRTCKNCAHNYYFDKELAVCKQCHCHGSENKSVEQICNPNNGTCYNCLDNRSGKFCEKCKPGYFVDISLEGNDCRKCYCHGNEHPHISPMCSWRTGACLSCTKHTSGKHCQRCALGYLGDAIYKKNCTKEVQSVSVSSNRELVLILSLTLVAFIILLSFLVCFCWWRKRNIRSRARFVSVEMRGASISSSYDVGLIDPVTGEAVHDLDCEQEVDTIKMTNGNLQIESPYDIDVSDTDRML